jgi:hypothetical protein
MALIARVSGDSWDWREEDGEADDGPLTSRSPSFVRLVGAEPTADSTLECITESTRHATIRPPADDVGEADAMLRRWSDLEVMVRTRALRLEETALRIHDRRLETVARAVLDDATAVNDALRVLYVMWSPSWTHPNAGGPMAPSFPVVQHVFEWLSGVLLRADDALVAALEERTLVVEDLAAVEYSSLFVRSIIDPMIAEAIRAHEQVNDELAATSLREVRERVLWLNWTARGLDS